MLSYKGYTGHVEYDDEAGIFHGEVLDLRDVITFQGRSVEEKDRLSESPSMTTWSFASREMKSQTSLFQGG